MGFLGGKGNESITTLSEDEPVYLFNICRLIVFQQQRRVDLLTISSADNTKRGQRQKVVFLTARVHPGESPASFVCQGTRVYHHL